MLGGAKGRGVSKAPGVMWHLEKVTRFYVYIWKDLPQKEKGPHIFFASRAEQRDCVAPVICACEQGQEGRGGTGLPTPASPPVQPISTRCVLPGRDPR